MDYNKIEDAVMKNALDVFRQSAVGFFGLNTRIIAPARTEIKNISISTGSTDYTFYTEDGGILHFEFQTTDNKSDITRFMLYDAGLYSKEKMKIRTVVVYSSDIKNVETNIDAGTIKYDIEPFYMSSMDGDKKFAEIRNKIEKKIDITKEEMLSLTLIPLMKTSEGKTEVTAECIKLVERIENSDIKNESLCMLYALLDKFGYKEGKEKIKEVFQMTQLGSMIYEDGLKIGEQRGIEKGIEEGMEKGLEKGLEKGMEKGIGKGKADLLIKQLMKRFKNVPDEYIEKIKQMSEAKIELIGIEMLDMESVKEIEQYF